MSAYAEYLHGMIDYDELKAATARECREEEWDYKYGGLEEEEEEEDDGEEEDDEG